MRKSRTKSPSTPPLTTIISSWTCSTCTEDNDTPVCEFCGNSQASQKDEDEELLEPTIDRPPPKRAKMAVDYSADFAWAYKHAPQTLEDLKMSLPVAKITQVQNAFEQSLGELSNHPLVLLYGPSGSCKSTCVRLVCKQLGLDLLEWEDNNGDQQEEQFARFLMEGCYPCLSFNSNTAEGMRRKVIVVESLPEPNGMNILLQTLQKIAASRSSIQVCICYVHTTIGESKNTLTKEQLGRIVGEEAMQRYCYEAVHFNPIAATRMKKTLGSIAQRENIRAMPSSSSSSTANSMGDLRNALNNLQFRTSGTRDESYDMLHAVGKLIRGKKTNSDGQFPYEQVARRCCLDPVRLGGFVFENFSKYALTANASLESYLQVAESCVLVEELCQSKWNSLERSGGEDDEYDAMDAFAESIIARTASCWQQHGGGEYKHTTLIKIEKPQVSLLAANVRSRLSSTQSYLRNVSLLQKQVHPVRFLTECLPFSVKIGRSQADSLLVPYLGLVKSPFQQQQLQLLDCLQDLWFEDNALEDDDIEE